MLKLLYFIYNDVITSYSIFDTIEYIKEELSNTKISNIEYDNIEHDNIEHDNIEYDNIKENLLDLILTDEPEIINQCDIEPTIQKYKLDNSLYYLNMLRTDMIKWKNKQFEKIKCSEDGWEIINHPDNLPCNNYILYLTENMPENITYKERYGWLNAYDNGFKKEVSYIVNKEGLIQNKKDRIWVDKRLFGKKWYGLFNSIKYEDDPLQISPPISPL